MLATKMTVNSDKYFCTYFSHEVKQIKLVKELITLTRPISSADVITIGSVSTHKRSP